MTERTEGMSANEAVADLGNEIMLLVEMIVEHAAPWLDGLVAAGHTGSGLFGGGSADETSTHHGHAHHEEAGHKQADQEQEQYNCGWCPLCAVVSMARGDRPEFSARAIEQLAQLVGVLRAVLADRWYPGEGIHMPGAARAERQDTGPAWTAARPSAPRGTRSGWKAGGSRAASGAREAAGSRAQRITVRKAVSPGSPGSPGSPVSSESGSAEAGERGETS